jgi:hypothetical protein
MTNLYNPAALPAALRAAYERNGGLTRAEIESLSVVVATAQRAAVRTQRDLSAIQHALQAAQDAGAKQQPRIMLDGFSFKLATRGSNVGAVFVVDADDAGQYFGKIVNGAFQRSAQCDAALEQRIIEAAADPYQAAVDFGKRFGKCSVCRRTLTDPESIELGIGPVCRVKMGW